MLESRGWIAQVLSDVAPLGAALVDALREAIIAADRVIVVLPRGDGAVNAAFEAGLAWALNKQLIVVAAQDAEVPSDLSGILIVRADPGDLDAIGFALDQIEDRPSSQRRSQGAGTGQPIGSYADLLLKRAGEIRSESEALALLVDAIEASGAAAVRSAGRDRGFDLGVWSDDLDAIAGNPLLIEVKRALTANAVRQSLLALHSSPSARLGLIVLTEDDTRPSHDIGLAAPVLAIGLVDLLERLRRQSFAEIVRDLRNQSVHGRPP